MRFFIIVPSSLIVLAAVAIIGHNQGDFDPQKLYPAPESGEELLRRAKLYEEAGEYEKALVDYAQAETLLPNDSSVYLGQGASFSALQQPTAAIEKYLIVKEIDQQRGRSTYIIDDLIEREKEKL